MSTDNVAQMEVKTPEVTIESLKPQCSVHEMKQNHDRALKALAKSGKDTSGKGKAKNARQLREQMEQEQAQELKAHQALWASYRELEAGKITIPQFLRVKANLEAGGDGKVAETQPEAAMKLEPGYATVELSKSQAKKLAREKREQEELARIQAELKNRPDPKTEELNTILRGLASFNFGDESPYAGGRVVVKEIRPDGHCMYRAVADQMSELSGKNLTFSDIRAIAAKEMRENPDSYLPYLVDTDGSDLKPENFSSYVDLVANDGSSGALEVTWGGHPELVAISNALKRMVVVHQQGTDPLKFGEQFESNGHPIHIVYQRHAYATGEHYNSIVVASKEE